MTTPADSPGGGTANGRAPELLAVTACPTGIAHTYMAAEKLQQAAARLGIDMKVETQGSIGAENVLADNDVREADGIIIAADKEVDRSRFVGKRVLSVGVAEGIHQPERADRAGAERAGVRGRGGRGAAARRCRRRRCGRGGGGGGGKERSVAYKALMNGVSYMIPFVVVGGLLIAVSLALGGHPTPEGLRHPRGLVLEARQRHRRHRLPADDPDPVRLHRVRHRRPARAGARHDRRLDREHRRVVRLEGGRGLHRRDRHGLPGRLSGRCGSRRSRSPSSSGRSCRSS